MPLSFCGLQRKISLVWLKKLNKPNPTLKAPPYLNLEDGWSYVSCCWMKWYDPCVVGYIYINTDPLSSTVFLICSELEIHTTLWLHLRIPQVVLECCAFASLWPPIKSKGPCMCQTHFWSRWLAQRQANRPQNSCFVQFLRNLLWRGKRKRKYHCATPPMLRQGRRHGKQAHGIHFGDTHTKWNNPNVIKAFLVCTF